MTNTICTENHMFSAWCVSCTCQAMSLRSLDEVETWFAQGIISSDALKGYRHVWAISADRSAAYDHYKQLPDTDEGRLYASTLSAMLPMLPSGRGYA